MIVVVVIAYSIQMLRMVGAGERRSPAFVTVVTALAAAAAATTKPMRFIDDRDEKRQQSGDQHNTADNSHFHGAETVTNWPS